MPWLGEEGEDEEEKERERANLRVFQDKRELEIEGSPGEIRRRGEEKQAGRREADDDDGLDHSEQLAMIASDLREGLVIRFRGSKE